MAPASLSLQSEGVRECHASILDAVGKEDGRYCGPGVVISQHDGRLAARHDPAQHAQGLLDDGDDVVNAIGLPRNSSVAARLHCHSVGTNREGQAYTLNKELIMMDSEYFMRLKICADILYPCLA